MSVNSLAIAAKQLRARPDTSSGRALCSESVTHGGHENAVVRVRFVAYADETESEVLAAKLLPLAPEEWTASAPAPKKLRTAAAVAREAAATRSAKHQAVKKPCGCDLLEATRCRHDVNSASGASGLAATTTAPAELTEVNGKPAGGVAQRVAAPPRQNPEVGADVLKRPSSGVGRRGGGSWREKLQHARVLKHARRGTGGATSSASASKHGEADAVTLAEAAAAAAEAAAAAVVKGALGAE